MIYGENVLVKWESRIELNVLSANNFYNNSSYHLLNLGCVPVTLALYNVSGAVVVTEALIGKQRPSQWLLWCMASLFFLSDVLFLFSLSMKSH